MRQSSLFVILLVLILAGNSWSDDESPKGIIQDTHIDIGTVRRGAKVKKTITITNAGNADITINGMDMTIPSLTVRAPQVIPSGGEINIELELDTAAIDGDVQGDVLLHTNDPKAPEIRLTVKGRVESQVDLQPRSAVFISAYRWEAKDKESSIYLLNKDENPLRIVDTKTEGDKFTSKIVTVEEGKRYQLSVKIKPDSQSGMDVGQVTVSTENEKITIPVYTFLKERVYLNPPALDFGRINLKQFETNPTLLDFMTQSVFVYKYHGEDFRIEIVNPPQFLSILRTPPEGPAAVINIPREGKTAVFEIAFTPITEKLKKGRFEGSIRITTNDKEFPVLEIPFYGEVI